MSDLTIHQGDCRDILPTLPAQSVQCVVTSPPYWGLRDYGTAQWIDGDPECDHQPPEHQGDTGYLSGRQAPAKRAYRDVCGRCGARRIDNQIGLEETPADFIATMVQVFAKVWRVLRDDGTLWLNLGDCYANDTKWGGRTSGKHVRELHGDSGVGRRRTQTGLPSKNLVGIPWRVAFVLQDFGWILRQEIIWHKPNCLPESVNDRPTTAHERIFLFTKQPRYYYDAEAIKEPVTGGSHSRGKGLHPKSNAAPEKTRSNDSFHAATTGIVEMRNKRSVWSVPSQSYSGSHFATFPEKLIEPCILAGAPVGGVVLDPFGGSGTTGRVALKHQRRAVLIELNPSYLSLVDERTTGVQYTLQEVA